MPASSAFFNFDIVHENSAIHPCTFGIEVTDARLADQCELGNLDPQHAIGTDVTAAAAVEAALGQPIPPKGARLVTVRPDCDAVGAMAVLEWRAAGNSVTPVMHTRIERVARMDRHDRGPWTGPRPLPTSAGDLDVDWPGADLSALAAMMFDRKIELRLKVAVMTRWLASGETPERYRDAARQRNHLLMRSLRCGATTVRLDECGAFARVISSEVGALALGYRLSDTVLATNTSFDFPCGTSGCKHTIARWNGTGLTEVCAAVSRIEHGWGGQPGIVGSPQFAPSRLTADAVADVMAKELAP